MKTAPAVHNSRHNLAAAQDTDPTFVARPIPLMKFHLSQQQQ